MSESQATDEARASEARAIVRRLIDAGEDLLDSVRRDIVDLSDAAVSPLLEILEDVHLALGNAPGGGEAPVHAARLLGELHAARAVETMLGALARTDPLDLLHDQLIESLPEIGASVVEPALRAYAANDDHDFRVSVASVLARTGVRDDRVFTVLLETLKEEPSHGAGDQVEYGDERAVPHLSRAFDDHEVAESDSPLANQDLVELRAAIEELGGSLTPAQDQKYVRALEPAERWRRQLRAALEARKAARRRPRPGRNDPCWCGSTKKYKKCHLVADQNRASIDGAR